jgi:hypothetical protein
VDTAGTVWVLRHYIKLKRFQNESIFAVLILGIPSFHYDFRPLPAGIRIFTTFSYKLRITLWTPKTGKGRKSLTNPGSGGKYRNLIIPFVWKRLVLPYFYSVLFSPAMWNWNKGGFVWNFVKGRKIKQRGVNNSDFFQRQKKSECKTLQGIPSFHDVFRPLLAGIINFTTFSYQLQISETLTIVFRLLLFIVWKYSFPTTPSPGLWTRLPVPRALQYINISAKESSSSNPRPTATPPRTMPTL